MCMRKSGFVRAVGLVLAGIFCSGFVVSAAQWVADVILIGVYPVLDAGDVTMMDSGALAQVLVANLVTALVAVGLIVVLRNRVTRATVRWVACGAAIGASALVALSSRAPVSIVVVGWVWLAVEAAGFVRAGARSN